MAQQDPHEIATFMRSLEAAKGGKGGKKGFSCKKSTFNVTGSDNISVDSWRFQDWDYKRDDLPTYARGLFTTKTKNNVPEIAIRGYDKFFNVGEVRSTEWQNVEANTIGPYELSVKENGCIIFMSGLEDGTLLVCSKHSTGAREDVNLSHAVAGEKWAERHLASVGKTTRDLAKELRRMNVTAVAELCDDSFEEHVLEYPPEHSRRHIHNRDGNSRRLPSSRDSRDHPGLHPVANLVGAEDLSCDSRHAGAGRSDTWRCPCPDVVGNDASQPLHFRPRWTSEAGHNSNTSKPANGAEPRKAAEERGDEGGHNAPVF